MDEKKSKNFNLRRVNCYKEFYRYYGDILFALSKSVDVIDLSGISKFKKLIKKEGILIYG